MCAYRSSRGVSSLFPEYTLEAYRAALRLGAGTLEMRAAITEDARASSQHILRSLS